MKLVSYRWLLSVAIAAIWLTMSVRPARADDPVDDIRRILLTINAPTPGAIQLREQKMKEAIDQMDTIGQLRKALILDWTNLDPGRVVEPGIFAVDVKMRREIGDRLRTMLEQMAASPDVTARLAVANVIGELGPNVLSTVDNKLTTGYARTLFPILAKLAEDPDLGVRQEALRALGNINGVPADVAAVFKNALQKDPAVGPRRIAADGLIQMVRVVNHQLKSEKADRKDLLAVLTPIAPSAAVGMADSDSEVRMLCLSALKETAQALADYFAIPAEQSRRFFPGPGQQINAAERENIVEAYKEARQSIEKAKAIIDSFRSDIPVFMAGLRDPEPRVRLAAIRAFENVANARLRLVRRAYALPTLLDAKGNVEYSPAELLKGSDFLGPFLEHDLPQVVVLLCDPDVRIRRSAAEMLEVLEDKAAPALKSLIRALQDPDRFVRLTIVKAIGLLPPQQAAPAIEPLALLLCDPDLDVRLAVGASLQALGSVAAPAVPALAQAVQGEDAESRLAAMGALLKIARTDLEPTIPALIKCLSDPDARVVKTACDVLARIGPPARSAIPLLRRLIGNDDADVRSTASDAILSILRR